MRIDYDQAKDARNVRERDLSFDRAYDFGFADAVIEPEWRHGEQRWVAYGYLDSRLHVLCYTLLPEFGIRVISFRKANKREAHRHGKALTADGR